MDVAATVAQKLLDIEAIKLSPKAPFTWASGILSPIYCDNRIVLSHPDARKLVINSFVQKIQELGEIDVIAGVATAGIPHAALIADRLNKPMIYIRSKAKAHGRQNMIEGSIKGDEKVLVIEDLISTGGSSIKAVEAVQDTGCDVVGVMAIFSYELPKATENFEQANCPFWTLSNYPTLLEVAVKENYISKEELATLNQWREAPAAWKG